MKKKMENMIGRDFIGTDVAAAGAAEGTPSTGMAVEIVPNSAGTERPRTKAPLNACDAHFHIVDPGFPTPEPFRPDGMTFDDYLIHQRRIGTTRAVAVQPKYHRTDPSCLLDALRRFGGNGRGIAVVRPDIGDDELRRLDTGGVRGLRFSVWNPADTVTTADMIEPLARRIEPLGWHVQIHMSGDQIVAAAALFDRLPCPIVFDHMGRLPPGRGPDHPAFRVICSLLDRGKAWVKLAGAYLNTEQGPPAYPDAMRIAQAFVRATPDRLVWGSDWPHVTERDKPDDAQLFDLLAVWVEDEGVRKRILVDNPAKLYGFDG